MISSSTKIHNLTSILFTNLEDYEINLSDVPSHIGSKIIAGGEEQETTQDKVIGAWEIPVSGHEFTILATLDKAMNSVRFHIHDSELPVNIVRKFYPYTLSKGDYQVWNQPESEYRIVLKPNAQGKVNAPVWNFSVQPRIKTTKQMMRDVIYSLVEKLS